MVLGKSVFNLMGTCLRLRMMSVASSTTPGIEENSCRTPSIFTAVMAAPSMELSKARRRALPTVVPQPRSNGCAEKRPYFSVSDSSSDARRFGFWKPFHIVFLPSGPKSAPILKTVDPSQSRSELLRVQLDDELLVDWRRLHVIALGHGHDFGLELLAFLFEPGHGALALCDVARFKHHGVLMHLFLDGHFFADAHEVRRNVDLLAVHADVAVKHKLPRLRTRRRQARAPHDVIKAALEHDDQVFASGPFGALGLLKIVAELPLQQPVGALDLLLFAQLQAVTRDLGRRDCPCWPGTK